MDTETPFGQQCSVPMEGVSQAEATMAQCVCLTLPVGNAQPFSMATLRIAVFMAWLSLLATVLWRLEAMLVPLNSDDGTSHDTF